METKKCNKCGETKEVSAFSKDKRVKSGLQRHCKVCNKASNAKWHRNNKEKSNASSAKWQRNNREKHKALMAAYKAKAKPCVYRIKHKVSGHYYVGHTSQHFWIRISNHFSSNTQPHSPLTGLNKDEWNCEVLCYGTKEQVKDLEKVLLNTRVGEDPLCLNKKTC